MSVSGISASQLAEIQAVYAARVDQLRNLRKYGTLLPEEVSTPDGSVTLSVTDNWPHIRATNREGRVIYSYADRDGVYTHPAITPDGTTGYFQRKTRGCKEIVKIPIHGFFKRPRPIAYCDSCDTLTVNAEGTALATSSGHEIFTLAQGDQSRWARLFGRSASLEKVGSISEPISDLQYLKDGSLLVFPQAWGRRCYIVRAGVPGSTRIPVRDISQPAYRDRVLTGFPFLSATQIDDWPVDNVEGRLETERVDRFLAQAGGLVDDEGYPAGVRWERNPSDPRQVAMFATKGKECGTLWTWNDAVLTKIAMVPAWAVPGDDRDWSWGDDLKPRVMMDWTSDGQRVVLAYHLPNQARMAVHVVGLDGRCISFPPVDEMHFIPRPYPLREGSNAKDRLCVTIGNETHEIAIPDDLDTIDRQDWYLRAVGNAVLGGEPSRKPQDLHVERGDGSLVIGGISVPIRKPEGPTVSGDARPDTLTQRSDVQPT